MRLILLIALASAVSAQVYQKTIVERFGVAHNSQPIEFPRTGAALSGSHVMTGPEGVEVPWQPLSDGKVLVQSNLPASRVPFYWKASSDATNNFVRILLSAAGFSLAGFSDAQPKAGEAVIFPTTAPGGTSINTVYYLKNLQANGYDYQLSTSEDLSDTVDITTVVSAFDVRRAGFVVSGADLYAFAHGYATGNALTVASTGTLPAGLTAGVTYYVINVSANKFKLATTRANALAGTAIATSGGSGIHSTSVAWNWALNTGTPTAAPAAPVTLTTTGSYHEITNGLTGVRVAVTAANPAPYQLAAIQGVRLSDGTWTATGPNRLYNAGTTTLATVMTGYTATVVENGPLLMKVQARHTLTRPQQSYGSPYTATYDIANDTVSITAVGLSYMTSGNTSVTVAAPGGTLPCGLTAGVLYFLIEGAFDSGTNTLTAKLAATRGGTAVDMTCAPVGSNTILETMALAGTGEIVETISLYAGAKSVLVETKMDFPAQYWLNLRSAGVLEPNIARWRGHYALSEACGRMEGGGVNGPNGNYYQDSYYDLPTTGVSFSSCGTGLIATAPNWNLGTSGLNTGYYWMIFNSGASGSTPLAGYFTGRASKSYGPIYSGPGIYTAAAHHTDGAAHQGISMYAQFRSPSGQSTDSTTREWAIYTGPVSELGAGIAIQPIALEKNKIASINLTALATYEMEYGDPAGGWPAPFAENTAYDALVARIQTDSAYRTQFLIDAPELTDLVTMWMDGTSNAAEYLVSTAEQRAQNWQYKFAQRDSTHNIQWYGYSGFLNWQTVYTNLYAVLRHPVATAAQKARAKAVAAWAAHVIWDPVYAPLDAWTGEGLGNPNQVLQFVAYRCQHSLSLGVGGVHSAMSAAGRLAVCASAMELLISYVQLPPDGGAPKGGSWYQSAAMDPSLSDLLLWKNRGESLAPFLQRLRDWNQWMLDVQTPPEPRFGNIRKFVSSGDGNTAAIALPGMLATLLRGVDDAAAARGQWGWTAQNSASRKTFGQFTAPAALVINETATATAPNLVSRYYRGYWTVLRHGFNTANEHACWATNGSWYVDHRRDDPGQVTCYAHAAPMFIYWNANLYSPQTAASYNHNRAVYAEDLGSAKWNMDSPPLTTGVKGFRDVATTFTGLPLASTTETTYEGITTPTAGARWTRSTTLISIDPANPILIVRDRFTGANAGRGKVITWNMAATGDVTGTAGTISPTVRWQSTATTTPTVLPSNGAETRSTGIERLRFTGTTWAAHATGGIDWDFYVVPDGVVNWFVGNWGHAAHNTREAAEYNTANGQTFREQQHIWRGHVTNGLTSVFTPWRKGSPLASRTVSKASCGLLVEQTGLTVCDSGRGYVAFTGSTQHLASFDGSLISGHGVTIQAGPAEVLITGSTMQISLSGAAGHRAVYVPDGWSTPAGWTRSGNLLSIQFDGVSATHTSTR